MVDTGAGGRRDSYTSRHGVTDSLPGAMHGGKIWDMAGFTVGN